MKHRVIVLSHGTKNQTTVRLFTALATSLRAEGRDVELVVETLPRRWTKKLVFLLRSEVRTLRLIRESRALVVHTPLAVSVISMVAARLTGKKVLAFVWDVYPASTTYLAERSKMLMAVYWVCERLAYASATVLIAPSKDYSAELSTWRRKTQFMPLWPSDVVSRELVAGNEVSMDRPLRVAFAGQINGIRGIGQGMQHLSVAWPGNIELHVFSTDQLDESTRAAMANFGNVRLVERGALSPQGLQRELELLQVGWVTLDPGFDMPAFPSKSLAYLIAGLPIWFNGPPLPGYRAWLSETGLGTCIDEQDHRLLVTGEDYRHARRSYLERLEREGSGLEEFL